ADDLGGHALVDFGLVPRLGQDDQAGVGMEIDEPGADDAATCVYSSCCLKGRDIAAQDLDGVASDAHGAWEGDVARAIDYLAAGDQDIEHGGVEATISAVAYAPQH